MPQATTQSTDGLAAKAREAVEEHADQHRPLGGYMLMAALFNSLFVAFLLIAGRRDRLPERYELGDLLLLAAGTYKLSRLISKERVTSFLRAPFTRFRDDTGHGEVDEAARGTGVQRAIGELLICQYCLAQWIAAAFVAGHAIAPRATRATAALFTVFGLSDYMQLAYSAAEKRA